MERCCLAAFRKNKLRVGGISAQLLQSDSALQWGVEGWRMQWVDIIHSPPQQDRVGKRRKRSRVGPSPGLQLLINCSGAGPFHEILSKRKRLLQPGVICGLQCGWLSPMASGRWVFLGCSRISAPGSLPFPPYSCCRGCLQSCFSHIFLTPLLQLLHSVFYFILDILSQKQP